MPRSATRREPRLVTCRPGDRTRESLLKVPESYREVIVLCDLQEMSYAEAAATLGIPVGTVRSRLHRGHIALLDVLSRRTVPENSGAKL